MENENNIDHKIQQYTSRAEELTIEKTRLEKSAIILGEQLRQYQDQIQTSFGTLDINELKKIADGYVQEIEQLENNLKMTQSVQEDQNGIK